MLGSDLIKGSLHSPAVLNTKPPAGGAVLGGCGKLRRRGLAGGRGSLGLAFEGCNLVLAASHPMNNQNLMLSLPQVKPLCHTFP